MRRQDWIELFALSLLWGIGYATVALALRDVPPLTLVLCRCGFAAVFLIAVLHVLGHRLPGDLKSWRNFAVMSVLNNVLPFSLFFFAQLYISSGLTSVMNATTPLMTLMVARVLAGESLVAHKFGGVLLGLAGVGILIGPDLANYDGKAALGMLASLAATLSYGFSGLWGRRFKTTEPMVSAASQLTASTLIMLPIAAYSDRFWTLPLPRTSSLLAILSLAILSTALAYILFFRIMARAGSNNVMLVTLLIPVTAIGIGVLALGEALSVRQMVGALVIGASLLIIDGRLFGFGPKPDPKPAAR